ncbi:hypothetical protein [Nocardia sp. R7R-8]|uniref:hypothetical protein n=1 Tax=Nocardia sp. R7R-8 TaxID=3459304 RepID=UPI00403DF15A
MLVHRTAPRAKQQVPSGGKHRLRGHDRPDAAARQGHTVVLRAGRKPAYTCAQDFLLATELPTSESMSSAGALMLRTPRQR